MRSDDGPTMSVCALLMISTLSALAAPAAAAGTPLATSHVDAAEPGGEDADADPCVYVSTDPPAVGTSHRCPQGQYVDIGDGGKAPSALAT